MSLHTTSGRWHLGLGLAIVATLLWGTLPLALVLALRVLDPYSVTFYRILGAGLILLIILWSSKRLPPLMSLTKRDLTMVTVSVLGFAGNYLLFLLGLKFISPSAAQIVIQVAPLLLLLGGLLIYREPFSVPQWVGLVFFTSGLVLFFHDKLNELMNPDSTLVLGIGLVFVSAGAWAVYALTQKQLLKTLKSQQIMMCLYLASAALLLPVAKPLALLELDTFGLLVLAYCTLNSLFAYGSFAEALEHWEASRVSAILALSPLVTIGSVWFSMRWFPEWGIRETVDALSLVGAGMVIAGSLITAVWKTS